MNTLQLLESAHNAQRETIKKQAQKLTVLTGALQSIRDLAELGDNTDEAGMSHNFYKIAYLCDYTMERINDLSNNPKPDARTET